MIPQILKGIAMNKVNLMPFNLDLLIPTEELVKNIRPVKVLDIFDGLNKNFHTDGLFSYDIFGKIGDERRNRLFSYINMRVPIFHPVLFKAICDLRALYEGIMSGKDYAVFNKTTNDFVAADITTGQTGYAFFMTHFPKLKFEDRPSIKREFNIKLVNKYRNNAVISKLVVMPAGLRDYSVDENGKPSEDEINPMYRKILAASGMLDNVDIDSNLQYLDSVRYKLQNDVGAIYKYIINMLEGKNKFVLGKWAGRKTMNSTRNVISSCLHDSPTLFGDTSISTTQTSVGMYQYLRATMPLAIKHIRDTHLYKVFVGPNAPAVLVNKKTLKKELVDVDSKYYDSWMTNEGLEATLAGFSQDSSRHDIVEIHDHYLGLIYKGTDRTFKFLQDIDELPEGRSVEDVHPITMTELLYISIYSDSASIPCLITRYPITGYGSIYPSYAYLKSTTKSEVRNELDDEWNVSDSKAVEFPIRGNQFYSSFSVASKHLQRLSADYDGDVLSLTCLLTQDAKDEIHKTLNSKDFYVDTNRAMFFKASTDIIDLVVASMTG
jgi:hypothetical protein